MAINRKRSSSPVGNFNFLVMIKGPAANQFGDMPGDITLELPVDKIDGLGFGQVSAMKTRLAGDSSPILKTYPGLTTPKPITLEGKYLYSANGDIAALNTWISQAQGLGGDETLLGYRKDVEIYVSPLKKDGTNYVQSGTQHLWTYHGCWPTEVNFSAFDINSPAFSFWTMTLEWTSVTKTGIKA